MNLEKIGKKLGYKYVRYCIPFRVACWKYQKEIDYLKSMLSDELSVKTLECAIKSTKTRNYKHFQEVYDRSFERTYTDLLGDSFKNVPLGSFDSSQYFPVNIINLSTDEVFIDGGGFIGDTTLNFIEKTKGKFKKIHVFEPVKINFDNIPQIFHSLNINQTNIAIHNCGLSSSEKEVCFNQNSSGATIDIKGDASVKLVALDKYLSDAERKEITYIKLDIEGSEMEALEGMRETITKYKPKLAICVYHKPKDIWEIPLFIKSIDPSYKLYLRQHHPVHETVCYAI
jgi:FkbM family methyltransferase